MAWSTSSSALICLLLFIFYSSFSQQPPKVHGDIHSGPDGQRNWHMENVAPRGMCSQSTMHNNSDTVLVGHNCTQAINGDTTGEYEDGNCIHTATNDKNPYWEVELKHRYKIQFITVYARSNTDNSLSRMDGVSVKIDKKTVHEFSGKGAAVTTISAETELSGLPRMGKTVRLFKTNKTLINICEVQVWVCARDYHGNNCSVKCSDNCLDEGNRICNFKSGRCKKGCKNGYHGRKCNRLCGHCHAGSCERNGSCSGKCQEGWKGAYCKKCQTGRYGQNCSKNCGQCSGNGTCNRTTGKCLCTKCQTGRYGQNCSKDCGQCSGNGACNRTTGECQEGCKDGWNGSLCTVCARDYHGNNCSVKCSDNCLDEGNRICNFKSGRCKKGCKNGYHGRKCNRLCGHCHAGSCERNGSCSGKCQEGWKGAYCKKCQTGRYGQNCSKNCGQCSGNGTCNRTTGKCLCTKCQTGRYGQNCSKDCGQCSGNGACNRTTGECQEGCKDGWNGSLCTECQTGRYGQNCSKDCGQCSGSGACNRTTGECQEGCKDGWSESLCTECQTGRYGQNCSKDCGQCSENGACHRTTGKCQEGCKDGWNGSLCTECQTGRYGQNCKVCGQCSGSGGCNRISGECQQGCKDGWKGLLCTEEDSGPSVVTVVSISLVIVLVVGAAVVIVVKRGHLWPKRDEPSPSPAAPGLVRLHDVEQDGMESTHHQHVARTARPAVAVHPCVAQDNHIYGNEQASGRGLPAEVSHHPQAGDTSSSQDSRHQVVRGEGVSGAENLYMNTSRMEMAASPPFTSIALPSRPSKKSNGDAGEAEDEDEEDDEVYTHADLYAMYSLEQSRFLLDSFQTRLLQCLAHPEELTVQFQKLPKGMRYAAEAGNLPENTKKSRFKKLYPYDKNRVVLKRPMREDETDYINASFISGIQSDKDYIAAQGPLPQTMSDMWWMVWQEGVFQIVMVTNLVEQDKTKCVEYWPPQGQTVTYGLVTVTSEGEEEKTDFVVRSFSVTTEQTSARRTVHLYHYLAWPDHGVPVATSLVYFWRYVNSRATAGVPLLVHCSAGVGRTGTYIALDIACGWKSEGLDVSISSIVTELRRQRAIMVQTEAQYKFLHEAVLEEHTSSGTLLTLDQLDQHFPAAIDVHMANTTIDQQFKTLKQLKTWAKQDTKIASLPENQGKNRDPTVLPGNNQLIYLDSNCKDRNQYINAVFMSSVMVKKGFLMTQLPLPDTVVDLWRLVEDRDIRIIVSLGAYNEQSVRDYTSYWPQDVNQTVQAGIYTVYLDKVTAVSDTIVSYCLHVDAKERRSVKLLHYTDWTTELPIRMSDVMQLIELLRMELENVTSPVIVQCLDGAIQSGMFCVLCDVISRMMEEEEVDVFSTVRYLHQVRPQALDTLKQYRYCFRVAQACRDSLKLYANA